MVVSFNNIRHMDNRIQSNKVKGVFSFSICNENNYPINIVIV